MELKITEKLQITFSVLHIKIKDINSLKEY